MVTSPLAELRLRNYRAYLDSGLIRLGGVTPITGRNDAGKSGLLHGLQRFFDLPRKGGLSTTEVHGQDSSGEATIEVAFHPDALSTQEVQIDAKNKVELVGDRLVDEQGLFRLRVTYTCSRVVKQEACIEDVDDPELFPLATKNHDELLGLLETRGLPAVRAGKETNQAKRNALRDYARQQGKKDKVDWVDVSDIADKLRKVLPEFVLFSDVANYAIGETPVQNQFKAIVDKAFQAHTGAQQIELDIRGTIQQEFNKVFERLKTLSDTVSSIEAEPKVSWKKAVDGIGLQWGDDVGQMLPYEMRGAGVRRLFMLAYFQYQAAASLEDPNGPKYVFAVEEPEVHLHPSAQHTLVDALRELADAGHSVIYTTHSPVFVSEARIEDVALVVRESGKARVQQSPEVNVDRIAEELGVEASHRLVGRNYVVLVEGQRDVRFYEAVLELLHAAGETKLDPAKVLFLQGGGADNVKFNVTSRCIDKAGLKWAVLADSDRETDGGLLGEKAAKLAKACKRAGREFVCLDRSTIENYLDPIKVKEVTGVDCRIPEFGKPTDESGVPLVGARLKRVKDNCHKVARLMEARGILARSVSDAHPNGEFVDIFEQIRTTFDL
ncbi:AAA family ATPase [candidate division WOR-3 bacterium]|nr:AAA family ATPase [candidate division WOR-3 bacterium]